jgi:hypothetical protein
MESALGWRVNRCKSLERDYAVPHDIVFLAVADRQVVAPAKARQRAVETRRAKRADHRDELGKAYRQWRHERREALLAGPYGHAARRLIGFLENMGLHDGAALIRLVERQRWCSVDVDTRFGILALVDGAVIALRERHWLPPFDDALPTEAPSVFLLIREALG